MAQQTPKANLRLRDPESEWLWEREGEAGRLCDPESGSPSLRWGMPPPLPYRLPSDSRRARVAPGQALRVVCSHCSVNVVSGTGISSQPGEGWPEARWHAVVSVLLPGVTCVSGLLVQARRVGARVCRELECAGGAGSCRENRGRGSPGQRRREGDLHMKTDTAHADPPGLAAAWAHTFVKTPGNRCF